MKKSCKGGGPLLAVMLTLFIASLLIGSVASIVSFQRKQGIRQQLKLHSMNAAEAAIDYAYTYITNDANFTGLDQSNFIPPSGGAPLPFAIPPSALSFVTNQNPLPSSVGERDPIQFTDMKVTVMPRPNSVTRIYVDPNDRANDNNPNRGQWVYLETIRMVAAVTSKQGEITQTSYAQKDLNFAITNLFQHAIFFQGQLHLHRGFKVMGSVHTNGNLILNAHNGDRAIYNGFVAAGHKFYRGSIIDSGGSGANGYALVPQLPNGDLTGFTAVPTGAGSGTTFTPFSGGDIPIYISSPTPTTFLYRFADTATDSRTPNWKDIASNNFLGRLQDMSHNVPIINPIGTSNYNMNTDGSANNSPYFLIEPLLPANHVLRTATTSQKTNYRYNLSANASLVLRVEFAARDALGNLVDPTALTYQPLAGGPFYPQSQNPSNYIVRAYAKPATMARVNDPTDRLPIPFPTDVIGRADYKRYENGPGTNYNYVAGADPQPIDILGTERNVTLAVPALVTANAGLVSPARIATVNSTPATQTMLDNITRFESLHRYRIETYRATLAPATYQTWQPHTTNPWPATAATWNNNSVLQSLGTTQPNAIAATNVSSPAYPLYGLHDSRLGRGVSLLTLDISRLKQIMEAPLATVELTYGLEAYRFRLAFNNGNSQWNGIVYVEFPTSTNVVYNAANPAASVNPPPPTSAYRNNATRPWDPSWADPTGSYLDTYLFAYAPPDLPFLPQGAETRYPLRSANTTTIGRFDQTVPIAKEFRAYPGTVNSQTITDPVNAILGLQVINSKRLPTLSVTRFDGNAGNVLNSGFTLATNAPLYLVGSWNADGNYATGTNVTSTDPTAYATTDTLTSLAPNNPEVPSAIFCDMFTVLSPGWATQTNYPNSPNGLTRRQNSFPGWGGNSDTFRRVTWKNATERIEVSACIATGDFPIFEFFPHALEDFGANTNGTPCTSLVVKGAMVSMFTSEVQHIKQAYGRNANQDIQVFWSGHGANNFPSPRLHQFILDGNFPPGTPQAYVPSQSNFRVLFKGDPLVSQAGF